jgi:hypothetical protein
MHAVGIVLGDLLANLAAPFIDVDIKLRSAALVSGVAIVYLIPRSYILSVPDMALFISDDRVRELAERLARLRRTSVDEAVRQALERALAEDRAERDRVIRAIWAEVDAMPQYDFDESDMYDESGAPK